MRETKYRGKVWGQGRTGFAVGDLIHRTKGVYIRYADSGTQYLVRPETIGQFTGRQDANGVEIYEGDILEARYDADHPEHYNRSQVVWASWRWAIWEPEANDLVPLDDFTVANNIVVGNIYDNLDMLEVPHG